MNLLKSPKIIALVSGLILVLCCLSDTGNTQREKLSIRSSICSRVPERIVAIGDLHGNLEITKKALILAGAIDKDDHWIGGALVVVQLGDLIDRGSDDRAVLDFIENLKEEAKKAGGQLITLLGNHELMNAVGDFRYVSLESMQDFKEFSDRNSLEDGRFTAFKPGGFYAKKLAHNPIAMIIGDTLFVHAGLEENYLKYGIERMNSEAKQFLRGEITDPPKFLTDSDGPLWTRRFVRSLLAEDHLELRRVLTRLHCTRMVVGHTPSKGGITTTCDGMCWLVDVGLSFSPDAIEVLEITPSGVKVLKAANT